MKAAQQAGQLVLPESLQDRGSFRLADGRVSFAYKDYRQSARVREMTLPVEEFIRRFPLHVLPESFVRIRYFGLLSNRHRKLNLARCRNGSPVSLLPRSQPLRPWRRRTGEPD